jgi:hypothetical protein
MYDVLFELKVLSEALQRQDMNILKADKAIHRTIKIIETSYGTKTLEAQIAYRDLKYKSIDLVVNKKHKKINKDEFIKELVLNLKQR